MSWNNSYIAKRKGLNRIDRTVVLGNYRIKVWSKSGNNRVYIFKEKRALLNFIRSVKKKRNFKFFQITERPYIKKNRK